MWENYYLYYFACIWYSCGEKKSDEENLDKEVTQEMLDDGYKVKELLLRGETNT